MFVESVNPDIAPPLFTFVNEHPVVTLENLKANYSLSDSYPLVYHVHGHVRRQRAVRVSDLYIVNAKLVRTCRRLSVLLARFFVESIAWSSANFVR